MLAGAPRRRRVRPRLSDEAATHVRELIVSGQLHTGDFIRPEAVAEELEISATPAREGLLLLQAEGFLEVEPRRGFRVTALSTKDVSDMFEAQALLAGELGARAAQNVTDAQLAELESLQDRLEAAAKDEDLDRVEELNFEFHRAVYFLADAPKIAWLLRSTLRYAPRRFYATIGGWPEATLHDHREIMTALRSGDVLAAREALSGHIRSAGRLLVEHLEAQERGDRSAD
ncbi:MAG: FCD domain-containing protein [Propionibacteriales bacterium]|nr:FCD domain-containing protein [Propionibacteriales bacterium]